MSAIKFLSTAAVLTSLSVSAFAQTYTRTVEPVPAPEDMSSTVRAQYIKPGDVSPEEYARLLEEADRVKAYMGETTYPVYENTDTVTSSTIYSADPVVTSSTTTSTYVYDGRPTYAEAAPSTNYQIELFDTPIEAQTVPATTFQTVTPATTTVTAATFGSHRVVKGDTLYNISKRYNISLSELKSSNNLYGNNIGLGQVLSIPSRRRTISENTYTTTQPTFVRNVEPVPNSGIYAVLPGDTLYSIARRSCTSVSDITAKNNIAGTAIHPGQRISLPSGHCLR